MNKEETKQILENMKDSIDCDCKENMEFRQALETAIDYIENSISKETIKEKIEEIEITRKYTVGTIVAIKTILQELLEGK